MTSRYIVFTAFLIALLPVITYTVDDAYINFRYSENLIAGHGLTYNIGERVEGYTNFLWVIFLAPFSLFPIPIEVVAKVFGIFFSLLTLIYIWKLSNEIGTLKRFEYLNLIAPIAIILSISFDVYTIAGLETPLFTFLIVLSVYLVYCEGKGSKYVRSSIVLLLSALTRPEGVLVFCITAVYVSWKIYSSQKNRIFFDSNLLRWISLFVIPGFLYFVFRYSYFGLLLPNTFAAKTGGGFGQVLFGFNYVAQYALTIPAYLIFLAIMILMLSKKKVKERPFFIYIASIIGIYALYICIVGGDWMKSYRFCHPLIPLGALLFQEGCKEFIKYYIIPVKTKHLRKRYFQIALVIIFIITPVPTLYSYVEGVYVTKDEQSFWERAARQMAYWLKDKGKPDSVIAMGDIGEIGYRTNFKVIDMLGLVTPYISQLDGGYTRKNPRKIAEYVMGLEPEYILFITRSPTQDNMPIPHHDSTRAIVNLPGFHDKYRTFFQLKVSDSPYYWIISAHIDKTDEPGLADGISYNFEKGSASGWRRADYSAGLAPTPVNELDFNFGVWGFEGEYALNVDSPVIVTTTPFLITKNYFSFLSAGDHLSRDSVIELIVDGAVVKRGYPPNSLKGEIIKWDVKDWINTYAHIRLHSEVKTGYFVVDCFRQTNE